MKRLAVVILCAAGFGCGDDSSGLTVGGDDGGTDAAARGLAPVASVDDGCAQVARLCDRITECAPFFMSLGWGDNQTCVARTRAACVGDATAAGNGATPAALAACGRAIAAASCADLLNNRVGECRIAGTLAAGAACGTGSQCQTTYCKKTGACGVCATRASAGGSCGENEDCELGLVCAKGKVCATPGAAGAACDDRRPCAAPLVCAGGACATAGKAGDPCSADDTCDGWHGVVCNTQAKVCQTFKTVAAGETCGLLANALCAANGDCRPNALAGVCQSAAGDGEACGPAAQNRKCLAPAVCANGACKLPSAAACR